MLRSIAQRKEWQFFAVLPKADPALAAAWWATLILRGILPAVFAIVMGAPTEHWIHVSGRGGRGGNATATANANEQWPYQFKLTGTSPDDSIIH